MTFLSHPPCSAGSIHDFLDHYEEQCQQNDPENDVHSISADAPFMSLLYTWILPAQFSLHVHKCGLKPH